MSDDLVKRLMEYRPTYGWPEEQSAVKRPTLAEEAAARIEQQAARIAALGRERARAVDVHERLAHQLYEIRRAIPDRFLLVPPDGGDVTTLEAVQAMVEELESYERAVGAIRAINALNVAHIAKLEEGLRPFDDALGKDEPSYSDKTRITLSFRAHSSYTLTLGDLRRARALLGGSNG